MSLRRARYLQAVASRRKSEDDVVVAMAGVTTWGRAPVSSSSSSRQVMLAMPLRGLGAGVRGTGGAVLSQVGRRWPLPGWEGSVLRCRASLFSSASCCSPPSLSCSGSYTWNGPVAGASADLVVGQLTQ